MTKPFTYGSDNSEKKAARLLVRYLWKKHLSFTVYCMEKIQKVFQQAPDSNGGFVIGLGLKISLSAERN